MHQWNSEKKQRTFQNAHAGLGVLPLTLLDICILRICFLTSFDRLGTGNVICSGQTGESWQVTECRQPVAPSPHSPPPPSLKSYKILQLSQRSEEAIHVTGITQLRIGNSKLKKEEMFVAVN